MSSALKNVAGLVAMVLLVITLPLFNSCNTSKKVKYFQDVPDSLKTSKVLPATPFAEPKIEINDVLYISVQTIDQKEVVKATGTAASSTNEELLGYKVDKNGDVDVPLIGTVKVAGLTTADAKELLKERAKKLYVDPVVNIKFANHYVDVFGEVSKPGRILFPTEKVSVIDALTLAGDLNIQGKRENVLLVRDEDGKKVTVRFDLTSTDMFQSPYFYLKSGDYIYVEPNLAKKRGATVDATRDRYISYIVSFISLGLAITNIVIATSK